VTHIITDRLIDTTQYSNIEVVQTQWIVDCCNFEVLLPSNEYAPGADLPPHISPLKTLSNVYAMKQKNKQEEKLLECTTERFRTC